MSSPPAAPIRNTTRIRTHTQTQSFENITSIDHSLQLLRRFQAVLQRESLKSDLDSKLTVIFQNYGMELEQVRACMCMRACVLC